MMGSERSGHSVKSAPSPADPSGTRPACSVMPGRYAFRAFEQPSVELPLAERSRYADRIDRFVGFDGGKAAQYRDSGVCSFDRWRDGLRVGGGATADRERFLGFLRGD